jgi:hypothetical protein
MQFVGDAVMAVFGAPFPQRDHADRAVAAAAAMHALQAEINAEWRLAGLPEFGLGIGLSTGPAAAALLGSAERLEYTLVGDTVNLSQRLQGLAAAGETVISSATRDVLSVPVPLTALPAQLVKGRQTPVEAFRAGPPAPGAPSVPQLQPAPGAQPVADAMGAPAAADAAPAAAVSLVSPPDPGSQDPAGRLSSTSARAEDRQDGTAPPPAAPPPAAAPPAAAPPAAAPGPGITQVPRQTQGIRTWKLWKALLRSRPH